MKSFTASILFILLAPLASAQAIDFADYFEDATMRIDYFHTANATYDEIAVDQIYINDIWAGNPKKLLPPTENGRYAIKVVDIASNKIIYSRHYLDIVFEYKGTDAAKEGRKRTYHQSALIPCPRRRVLFTIERRDKHHMLHSVFSQIIDPNDRSIRREPASPMDKSFVILKNGHPHDFVDLVFVAEGYRSEEFEKFKKDSQRFVDYLFTVDAWAPEAQEHDLGRQCLESILSQPGWMVRILTKNAAVRKDFDLIEKYSDRVLIGLSITATPDKSDIIKMVEPNASTIEERMETLQEAHKRGLRTYGMFCPILPSVANLPTQIDELIKFAIDCGVEEVFAEAVNPRGRGLILTQQALESKGYHTEAAAINNIRSRENWSRYVVRLIKNIQRGVREFYDINKLRFLQYPSGLKVKDINSIKQDDTGVIWL